MDNQFQTEMNDEARAILAVRLIDAWIDTHQKPIPWEKAVGITAIVTQMSDNEKDRLLAME